LIVFSIYAMMMSMFVFCHETTYLINYQTNTTCY
jgi:hypothetical protein